MTTIILMRHGETTSNIKQIYQGQGDGKLSENGIKQAHHASAFLSDTKIDAIYSSDLTRAFHTASIIAKPHKLKVKRIPGLRERYYGVWEGLKFTVIKRRFKKLYGIWLKDPDKAVIPGAESLLELQDRGHDAIKRLINKHKDNTILIVGHGGINRTILFKFLGMNLNNFWKIKQDNCCINVIDDRPPYARVVLVNSTCFLRERRLERDFAVAPAQLKKKDVLA